jgi:hypothetical protein
LSALGLAAGGGTILAVYKLYKHSIEMWEKFSNTKLPVEKNKAEIDEIRAAR